MPKTILFMLPHGAAKSVMARTYFQKLVDRKRLDFDSTAARPFPEDVTYPMIVELLQKEGLDASDHKPRKVITADIDQAFKVISIGCDLNDLPKTDKVIESWDVAMVSEDPEGSWQQIKQRVKHLVSDLEMQKELL
jgi:protein-tyrosine-phosphatase